MTIGTHRPALGSGIAAWGDLSLVPISEDDREVIRSGHDVNLGYMIDFFNNFKRSIDAGQSIYRCVGHRGYLWAATYDEQGKGTLRYRAVNQEAVDSEIEQATALIEAIRADLDEGLQEARPLVTSSPDAQES